MRGNEVRNQILLLTRLLGVFVEHLLETMISTDPRLHHFRQRAFRERLRRNLQVTTDVMLRQLLHVLRRLVCEVVTYARRNQHLLDTRKRTGAPVEFDQRRVIGVQIRADTWVDTGRSATRGLYFTALAREPIHVGGWAAQVRDDACEARNVVPDRLDLSDYRVL